MPFSGLCVTALIVVTVPCSVASYAAFSLLSQSSAVLRETSPRNSSLSRTSTESSAAVAQRACAPDGPQKWQRYWMTRRVVKLAQRFFLGALGSDGPKTGSPSISPSGETCAAGAPPPRAPPPPPPCSAAQSVINLATCPLDHSATSPPPNVGACFFTAASAPMARKDGRPGPPAMEKSDGSTLLKARLSAAVAFVSSVAAASRASCASERITPLPAPPPAAGPSNAILGIFTTNLSMETVA